MKTQYQQYQCRITGVTPLLMHNGLLADPCNEITRMMKAVSGKRDKTESDHAELSRLEWFGGLYVHDGKPVLPGEMIEAMLLESAKKKKKGVQAKAGLIVPDNSVLEYEGPKDIDAMWKSGKFLHKVGVRVQKNKIIRTRPVFYQWAATLDIHFLPGLLNKSDVEGFVEVGGQIVGLGDWRPKFGRFVVDAV